MVKAPFVWASDESVCVRLDPLYLSRKGVVFSVNLHSMAGTVRMMPKRLQTGKET